MIKKSSNSRTSKHINMSEYDMGPIVDKIVEVRYKLKCKNEAQKIYSNLIDSREIIIACGPSGCGKSYISIAKAIELLQATDNSYKKIVVSKPAVESEEKLGFMPGDQREKMEPHIASTMDIFDKILGKNNRVKMEEKELLIVQPVGFLRGKTIDNSIIIIEEAQNLSPNQCKTILTRIGANSKLIISGDIDQSDRYKDVRMSGLFDIMTRHLNIPEIAVFEFSNSDIVRNPIISKILSNYNVEEVRKISDYEKIMDENEKRDKKNQKKLILNERNDGFLTKIYKKLT